MYILDFSFVDIFRTLFMLIDQIAFGLVDDVYNLIGIFASNDIFDSNLIKQVMKNTYTIMFLFSLFRIALLLVNSTIDPDKLSDKGSGITSILKNIVIMLVLLVVVPIAFEQSRKIQSQIVGENYIGKVFGFNVGGSETDDDKSGIDKLHGGSTMKRIALSSVISPDSALIDENGNPGDGCKDDEGCENAVEDYNKMMRGVNNGGKTTLYKINFKALLHHLNYKVKYQGDDIYVYNYSFGLSTIVGIFLTYILLTFGIDIAVRTVELGVLEVISPLFIATYVDPKSSKNGPFHKWLSAVGKSYASLFIKLAIIYLMLLFISLARDGKIFSMKGYGFAKIVLLVAILIFFKKAPSMIMGMFGADNNDNGGFSLAKKLGSAALIGGALTKAGHAATGAATGIAKSGYNQARNRRAQRKAIRKENGLTHGKAGISAIREAGKGNGVKGYIGGAKSLYKNRHDAYKEKGAARTDVGTALKQGAASIVLGAAYGAKAGYGAKDVKGAFKGTVTTIDNLGKNELGYNKNVGISAKVKQGLESADKGLKGTFGSVKERNEAIEAAQKNKKVQSWQSKESKGQGLFTAGSGKNQIIAGQGAFNKFVAGQLETGNRINNYTDYLAAQYMANQGCSSSRKVDNVIVRDVKGEALKDNDGKIIYDSGYEFKDKNGNIIQISNASLQNHLGGLIDPNSSGMLEQQKMWNNFATSQLNNYVQNTETASQITSTMQQNNANKAAAINNLPSIISMLTPALAKGLSRCNINIPQTSNFEEFKDNINNALNKANEALSKLSDADVEQKQNLEKQLKELQKISGKCSDAENTISMCDSQNKILISQYQSLIAAQEKIQPIYNSLEGLTAAEKSEKLSIAKTDIDKKIAYFDENKDKKS